MECLYELYISISVAKLQQIRLQAAAAVRSGHTAPAPSGATTVF